MSATGEPNEKPAVSLSPGEAKNNALQDRMAQENSSAPRRVYLLYLGLTAVLFVFLVVVAALALNQGWLPSR